MTESIASSGNPREVIGGNKPPIAEVLVEQYAALSIEVEKIALRANNGPKAIKNDADLEKVADLVKATTQLNRRVDDARKTEKQPYLDAGRDVDAFFKSWADRLDRIKASFERIATDYQREKAARERREREEAAARIRAEEERKRKEADKAKREETANRKIDEADALAAKAAEVEASAEAAAADLVRMRTDSGTLATVRATMNFEITNWNDVDLAALRPYLKREDVEKAIRTAVKIGITEIKGVRIYEDVKASFR